jgi:diguanylate cyclase (GGDEF)-like protein
MVAMTRQAATPELSPDLLGAPDAFVQTALLAGGVGLWEWNLQQDRVALSAFLETQLGYPTGGFPGTRAALLHRLFPVDRAKLEDALAHAAENGELDTEFRVIDAAGLARWFVVRGRTLRDSSGMPLRIVGTMQEIPATVVAERRMREQQRALLALVSSDRVSSDRVSSDRVSRDPAAKDGVTDGGVADLPLEEALRRITEVAGSTLDVERTSVWLFDATRTKLVCRSLYRRSLRQHMAGAELDASAFPLYVAALQNNRSIDASDAQRDARTAELAESYLKPLGVTSMLEATVRQDGELAGVVCHEHVGPMRQWLLDEKGFAASIADMVAMVLTLHDQRTLAARLAISEERYRTFVDISTEAILRADLDPPVQADEAPGVIAAQVAARARIAECNPSFARLLRAPSGEALVGRLVAELLPPGLVERLALEWVEAGFRFSEYEFDLIDSLGQPRWILGSMVGAVRDGHIHSLWSTWRDISQRRSAVQALEHQARHDPLTGLPNRKWVAERLQTLLAAPEARTDGVALLLMDLDHFKEINDALGHFAGDQLLKLVGPRLAPLLDAHAGEIARLGGDEFALILRRCGDEGRVQTLARELGDALRKPFQVGLLRLAIDGSIGAAIHPAHGHDASSLMRCADVAMYEAKRKGLHATVYSAALDRYSPRRLALANALDEAIKNGDLAVHYQPIVSLKQRRVRAVEALSRWTHPEYGAIFPEEFVPIAEMGDQIRHLTLHVLMQSVYQWHEWRREGLRTSIAVNLSTRVLVDASLVGEIRRILTGFDIPPECVHFEITESAMMADPARAIANVKELHKLGVGFSVDDFGTGFSSLTYLQQLQLVSLKIDRSFVTHMIASERDASIVHSTIQLAHALGLESVAEGVESQAVLDAISKMGCDLAQGYYIAGPQPGRDIIPWAKANGWF